MFGVTSFGLCRNRRTLYVVFCNQFFSLQIRFLRFIQVMLSIATCHPIFTAMDYHPLSMLDSKFSFGYNNAHPLGRHLLSWRTLEKSCQIIGRSEFVDNRNDSHFYLPKKFIYVPCPLGFFTSKYVLSCSLC